MTTNTGRPNWGTTVRDGVDAMLMSPAARSPQQQHIYRVAGKRAIT